MAALVRRCTRASIRGLSVFCLRSRPAYRASLSPLLERNLKGQWTVDFGPKYFCTNTQSVVDGATHIESGNFIEPSDSEGTSTTESKDSEYSGSSPNDLHRISQRLGSVRNEETLMQAFEVIKNAEGTL